MAMEKRARFRSWWLPYALIGGHAVNVWLEPRFTADVDVTVAADSAALARARAALEAAGYRVTAEQGADLPSGPDFVRFTQVLIRARERGQLAELDRLIRAVSEPNPPQHAPGGGS